VLAVRRCDSRKLVRAALQKEEVMPYITDLVNLVSGDFHQDLDINTDEFWFCQRPLKRSQKKCMFLLSADIKPRFIEAPDANQLQLWGQ
jgi:phage-related protein